MRAAVIGIGSNSVRMLAADIDGSAGVRILRDRAATRLFAGLDSERRLSAESMQRTAAAAGTMAARARAAGAETVRVFATSATRDAVNGADFLRVLNRCTAAEAEILSGESEAALSFIGAGDGGHCGVITSAADRRRSSWGRGWTSTPPAPARWVPCASSAC